VRSDPLSGVAFGTEKKPPPLRVVVHSLQFLLSTKNLKLGAVDI